MSAAEVEDLLVRLLLDEVEDEGLAATLRRFEDAGLMTRDRGVVVTFDDGSQFQVSIVQSAYADEEADR